MRAHRARAGSALGVMKALALVLVLACGLAAPLANGAYGLVGAAAAEDAGDLDAVEGEILIVYEDEALELDDPEDAEVLEDAGVVELETIVEATGDTGAVVLAEVEEGTTVEEAIEALEDDPSVAYVQPNYTYELLETTTSDPYATSSTSTVYNQYYLYAAGFTDSWDYVRVEGSVTVAVLDTGCNLLHEDLVGTVDSALAYDVTTGTLLSESAVDNNGDAIGHGTLVCGVIAACADNATGIAGASYNATVLPVKVFDAQGLCTTADVVAAYAYLDGLIDAGTVDNLRVINLSIGTYSSSSNADQAMYEAIAAMLEEHDVVTVCSGGNGDGTTAYTDACYPADYDVCVSVTALAADGSNASYSDYNAYKDISAYGESILSTAAGGSYAAGDGTSFAAPQVSAAFALLFAVDSDLGAAEAMTVLLATATAVTGNAHEESGSAGALDIEAAVLYVLADDYDGSGAGTWDFSGISLASTVTVWRLYNRSSGEHLYTTSETEVAKCVAVGWVYEGVGWYAPTSGTAVYRLYNPNNGEHLYTTSETEVAKCVALGWQSEGVNLYSAEDGEVEVYRLFNPNETVGTHLFTTSSTERTKCIAAGWVDEGVCLKGVSTS